MSTVHKSADEIRRAILREHRAGVDIGELLVIAVSAAQADLQLRAGEYEYTDVTSNRPGSWEAAILVQLIDPALVDALVDRARGRRGVSLTR